MCDTHVSPGLGPGPGSWRWPRVVPVRSLGGFWVLLSAARPGLGRLGSGRQEGVMMATEPPGRGSGQGQRAGALALRPGPRGQDLPRALGSTVTRRGLGFSREAPNGGLGHAGTDAGPEGTRERSFSRVLLVTQRSRWAGPPWARPQPLGASGSRTQSASVALGLERPEGPAGAGWGSWGPHGCRPS